MEEGRMKANFITRLNVEVLSYESLLDCLKNKDVRKAIHLEQITALHEKKGIHYDVELDQDDIDKLTVIIDKKLQKKVVELIAAVNNLEGAFNGK